MQCCYEWNFMMRCSNSDWIEPKSKRIKRCKGNTFKIELIVIHRLASEVIIFTYGVKFSRLIWINFHCFPDLILDFFLLRLIASRFERCNYTLTFMAMWIELWLLFFFYLILTLKYFWCVFSSRLEIELYSLSKFTCLHTFDCFFLFFLYLYLFWLPANSISLFC